VTGNKEIQPIEKAGLASKVFLLAYGEPQSGYSIAMKIYGHDHHGIRSIINKLSPQGYFTAISDAEDKRPKWLSNGDIIIEKIRRETLLVKHEEAVLKKILNSKAFRYLIEKQISKNLEDLSMSATEFILGYLDILIIISKEYKPFKQRGKEIDLEFNYDFAINKIQKDEKLMEKMREIAEKLFEEEDLPLEIIKDFPSLFILPENLTARVKGLSAFGKKYYEMKPVYQAFSELLET